MKYIKFLVLALIFLILMVFLRQKDTNLVEIPSEITEDVQISQNSPDIASILDNFFSYDMPLANLLININGEDIVISGDIEKSEVEKYLENQNMLDLKYKLALMVLPETLDIKLTLKAITTSDSFSLFVNKIQLEDYVVDVDFTLYSLDF